MIETLIIISYLAVAVHAFVCGAMRSLRAALNDKEQGK